MIRNSHVQYGIDVDKDPKYRFRTKVMQWITVRRTKPQFLFILDIFYFIGAVYQEWYIEERPFLLI